ncbi:MAG: hypothetical protein GTN86_02910 [Xanthomonadales bacterium]|nr:hypothetical protein [Xanthomonadales bacterium]NIN58964.1 hypothetical protein [Xanthomonadales bacterium]NIN74229.1 hypothetical protein [Xanthomonadales bacterium]NIO13902.1 hypothetical protein [Xanthomonadales bacterium]NIP11357.1 hypothetical protein [Xanthomonadales bacterium]
MKTIAPMIVLALLLQDAPSAWADDPVFRPFIVASTEPGDLETRTGEVIDALAEAGFELAGRYSPLPDTEVLVVTDEELLSIAAQSARGGYAAGQRVSITDRDGTVEVAFVNPLYIEHAYRLEASMQGIHDRLSSALGNLRSCGAGDKKMTGKKLRKYNYMMTMQKFDDPSELASFGSYQEALEAVETGLADPDDELVKVYRIDLPGKDQSVFGVGMPSFGGDEEPRSESYQMEIVDFEGCRKRAYFPYEVLVDGPNVEALHMRFRMAVHFPNLSMTGQHGFTKLMPYPKAVERALEDMLARD